MGKEKRLLNEVIACYGVVVIKRNSDYGYTARCEEMHIIYSDDTRDDITQYSRSFTCSGANYNKEIHCIDFTLRQYVNLNYSGLTPYNENHALNGCDFFRNHRFSIDFSGDTPYITVN